MTDEEGAISTALSPLAMVMGEWHATEVSLVNDDTLRVVFREATDGDELHVTVLPREAPAPVFKRLGHCAVRYSVRLHTVTDRRRVEVSALLSAIGAAIDERLATGITIAQALGADRSPQRVTFGREMLRTLLAPEIGSSPIANGWLLHDIYPSSHRRLHSSEELELIVDLRRDLRRLLFAVGRADDRPALIRTKNFSVVEITGARGEVEGAAAVRALLSFVFQLRDHEQLEVIFPSVLADLGVRALPPAPVPHNPGSLNLALDAECAQSCAFCSVKALNPAHDGGDAVFARAVSDLQESRARGLTHLRLNGYDPLAYSRVLDVLAAATRLGFDRVDVFSPCTRLADRSFCEDVIALLPAERRIHVPLYAADAAVHDGIVGRPGAYELVMAAIDNLVELAGARSVAILSVVTIANLAEMPALEAWSRARGLSFSAHMPYPMHESGDDKFYAVAPKQSEVAHAAVAIHRSRGTGRHDVSIFGAAPCVTYRAFSSAGIGPAQWLMAGELAKLPGTEYERTDIEHGAGDRTTSAFRASTIACPHASACALSTACGGAILRAYVERHGSEEFQPVGLRALVEAMIAR